MYTARQSYTLSVFVSQKHPTKRTCLVEIFKTDARSYIGLITLLAAVISPFIVIIFSRVAMCVS